MLRALARDVSLSALVAGVVTVVVGFTSTAVLVFQAARAVGADATQQGSWMGALGLGLAVASIVPSLVYRVPIATGWSTPGAAMLIAASHPPTLPEATGAFMLSAALVAVAGYSGWFERAMTRIPLALASAMLAGLLLRFGLDVFVAMKTELGLGLAMFATFVVLRRLRPRYAVPAALVVGLAVAGARGLLHLGEVSLALATPVFVAPTLSWPTVVSVALPLFVVTMASQNAPGVAVIRASGFQVPVSPIVGGMGLVTLVLAPFGGFAICLAAITAAICLGPEAHETPERRYVAAVTAGVLYLVIGVFGATVASTFAALPRELVMTIAGLALFGTIGSGLVSALSREQDREAALVTFLVTASGVTLAGVGAAFWGLLAGVGVLALSKLELSRS
jgi:benzoate membrane transport protein